MDDDDAAAADDADYSEDDACIRMIMIPIGVL